MHMALPVDPWDSPMTAQIRLLLLVLTLVYCALFVPAGAFARWGGDHSLVRFKPHRPRLHRAHVPRLQGPEAVGVRAVRFARRLLGVPYRYGGDSPGGGFDCSGFVRYVYAHFGFRLPHSSYADFGLGKRIERRALRPGDLVFFDGIGHVGMYVGDGRFIHAPHTGTHVQMTSLDDPWYRATYDGARRLLPQPRTPRQVLRRARIHLPSLRLF
jgi:cell wall-associated NlpC family hydrolase